LTNRENLGENSVDQGCTRRRLAGVERQIKKTGLVTSPIYRDPSAKCSTKREFALNRRRDYCNPKIKSVVLEGPIEKFLSNVAQGVAVAPSHEWLLYGHEWATDPQQAATGLPKKLMSKEVEHED
jgi:hypothetical protein